MRAAPRLLARALTWQGLSAAKLCPPPSTFCLNERCIDCLAGDEPDVLKRLHFRVPSVDRREIRAYSRPRQHWHAA